MRVFLSVDIEGVAGISHWDEATKTHADYARFQDQMMAEAVAACEGALAAGATAITIKDAHGTGRNLRAEGLPRPAELISGWSGHPMSMVQGLDETYDAAAFIGYHAKASDGGNPLSHTLTGRVHWMSVNGQRMAEFHLHAVRSGAGRCAGRLRVGRPHAVRGHCGDESGNADVHHQVG